MVVVVVLPVGFSSVVLTEVEVEVEVALKMGA